VSRPDHRELAAIFAGGAVGALARVWIGLHLAPADVWPWATFAINLAGSAALGFIITFLAEIRMPSRYRRPLLATGFCGTFTTFSTMQVELLMMLRDDRLPLALAYASASIAGGMLTVHLGSRVARRMEPRR
jgi:CrcB protein